MAQGTLFVGWGEVITGRERKALQVFNETLAYYTRLQQQGEIESFEPVILEPHGGDLAGFVLLKGQREKLDRLRSNEEFMRMTMRAQLIVHSVGIIGAYTGEELQTTMSGYEQQITELT